MKDLIPSFVQQSTPAGGGLNTVQLTYKISDKPIGDESAYGYLAYVTDNTRKKIMASGYGEMKAHIEHIKKSVGYIRKTRLKSPSMQLGLDLGE